MSRTQSSPDHHHDKPRPKEEMVMHPANSDIVRHIDVEDILLSTHGFVTRALEQGRTLGTAVLNGIPLELAFVITPEMNQKILDTYHDQTKTFTRVRDKVRVMLQLIATHFPDSEERSLRAMKIRGYFFTKIGLWGRE